jgi:hypothetical protein
MAHKAKPKKKPQDALAMGNPNPTSASKSKPKSAAKPNSKRAESTKTESPKTRSVSTKPASAKDGALASSSATKAVAKAPNSSSKTAKAPPTPTSATQETEEKPTIAILPRRQKKSNKNTDKVGPSALTLWKKSSGRSKTWTNSKRTKLTLGDLELLVQSKTTPVAFGWNFSMLTVPATFLRSQGIRSNEQPEAKKKRTSNMRAKACDDLDSEYESNWPLPRGYPSRRPTRVPEPVSKRMEGYHLRLTISHGGVLVNQEEFLKTVTLSTPPKVSAGSTNNPEKVRSDQVEAFIVVKLLYNESHADVYLVRKANNSMACYHAHQFVSGEGFSGNWATFSKRKMNRLRGSKRFYGECIQDGRKILVMEVEKKDPIVAETGFNIKNMVKEFPTLPGVGMHTFFPFFKVPDSSSDLHFNIKKDEN